MADWLDESADPRAAVLRLGVQLRHQVGGIAFPDRSDAFWTKSKGWAAVHRPLEQLVEQSLLSFAAEKCTSFAV